MDRAVCEIRPNGTWTHAGTCVNPTRGVALQEAEQRTTDTRRRKKEDERRRRQAMTSSDDDEGPRLDDLAQQWGYDSWGGSDDRRE
jgi:hypothetical protein